MPIHSASYFLLLLLRWEDSTAVHHRWFPRRHAHSQEPQTTHFHFPPHLLSQEAFANETSWKYISTLKNYSTHYRFLTHSLKDLVIAVYRLFLEQSQFRITPEWSPRYWICHMPGDFTCYWGYWNSLTFLLKALWGQFSSFICWHTRTVSKGFCPLQKDECLIGGIEPSPGRAAPSPCHPFPLPHSHPRVCFLEML